MDPKIQSDLIHYRFVNFVEAVNERQHRIHHVAHLWILLIVAQRVRKYYIGIFRVLFRRVHVVLANEGQTFLATV